MALRFLTLIAAVGNAKAAQTASISFMQSYTSSKEALSMWNCIDARGLAPRLKRLPFIFSNCSGS